MLFNLLRHQSEYQTLGFTVIEIIPEDIALSWGEAIVFAIHSAGKGRRIDVEDSKGEVADGIGGRLKYDLIDGNECEEAVPSMIDVYRILPPLLSMVTHQDVVVSPYPRSKVCGKRYPAGGGQQGWHFDTNGITVVVYLSTNEDGPTIIRPLDGTLEQHVFPKAGSMLLMRGREVWHCGGRVNAEDKVISPWNYYIAGDTWRPPGLDDQIYGTQ